MPSAGEPATNPPASMPCSKSEYSFKSAAGAERPRCYTQITHPDPYREWVRANDLPKASQRQTRTPKGVGTGLSLGLSTRTRYGRYGSGSGTPSPSRVSKKASPAMRLPQASDGGRASTRWPIGGPTLPHGSVWHFAAPAECFGVSRRLLEAFPKPPSALRVRRGRLSKDSRAARCVRAANPVTDRSDQGREHRKGAVVEERVRKVDFKRPIKSDNDERDQHSAQKRPWCCLA